MRRLERYLSTAFGGRGAALLFMLLCVVFDTVRAGRSLIAYRRASLGYSGKAGEASKICAWKEELLYVILIQHHPLERLDA